MLKTCPKNWFKFGTEFKKTKPKNMNNFSQNNGNKFGLKNLLKFGPKFCAEQKKCPIFIPRFLPKNLPTGLLKFFPENLVQNLN